MCKLYKLQELTTSNLEDNKTTVLINNNKFSNLNNKCLFSRESNNTVINFLEMAVRYRILRVS